MVIWLQGVLSQTKSRRMAISYNTDLIEPLNSSSLGTYRYESEAQRHSVAFMYYDILFSKANRIGYLHNTFRGIWYAQPSWHFVTVKVKEDDGRHVLRHSYPMMVFPAHSILFAFNMASIFHNIKSVLINVFCSHLTNKSKVIQLRHGDKVMKYSIIPPKSVTITEKDKIFLFMWSLFGKDIYNTMGEAINEKTLTQGFEDMVS